MIILKEKVLYTFAHICIMEMIRTTSKNITLRVNSELYDQHKAFCKKKDLLVSKQFEIMMEGQMEGEE